ncbi:hypothetical protein B7H18_03730 [Pseudomonas putida]|uniref:Uncharacterized protein n=3 Tax=Pseudomonas TaxID=286 RepID=A0A1X0ZMZ2_PSEPU|nr:hypothetical protein B7H18_03730 [Pseudomonas putida]ORL58833.1 hypothetical protein B7H17_25245 [Pseudomonas putida]ORL67159.1 hypothetical protein B7H19_19050 [Pseudomonas putida]PLP92068.1 hypothetical protein CX682_08915 [Pseudomonas sp. FFUP_PS_41]
MDYLITDAQVRQLQRGCPPMAVQEMLGALPHVQNASLDNDSNRRDEVSVWSTVWLTLPRLLKVRQGGMFERACSRIYKIGHEVADILVFFGLVNGCVWGYDYIQAQRSLGLSTAMAGTIVALTVAAIGAAASIVTIVRLYRKEAADGFTPLSGLLITELQVQDILRSSPPGYAIAMLNGLPVMAYFEKNEIPPEGFETEKSAIEPEAVASEKPQKWWRRPVWVLITLSVLWLAIGSLLSENPDTMAVIGSCAVIGLLFNALLRRVLRCRTKRIIAQRTGATW